MSRILPIGWMQLYVLIQWASCERNFLSCFDQCTYYGLHSLWEKFCLLHYRATAYSMMKLHEYSKVTSLYLRVIVRATETSSWPKSACRIGISVLSVLCLMAMVELYYFSIFKSTSLLMRKTPMEILMRKTPLRILYEDFLHLLVVTYFAFSLTFWNQKKI